MPNLSEGLDRIYEKLDEQKWFQELKAKWEELDPQSQLNLKLAGAAGMVLLVLGGVVSTVWSVYRLRGELNEKLTLLHVIQTGTDEVQLLRARTSKASFLGSQADVPFATYFESLAPQAAIDRSSLSFNEKAGASSSPSLQTKETLHEVSVKHVNIRQLVKYILAIEKGPRPLKLKNLAIQTKDDLSGYLDATLSLSYFSWESET